ncbi:MAG: GDP-L-fucose synthase [Candidatus Omnitrophica bacterium]|nr:GDP-L-fucose synthase [Candidatus Omnitrophota bacterium]
MEKGEKIYIAGHTGMVGSAISRKLREEGYTNIVHQTCEELDLRRQDVTEDFFKTEKPAYVFLAAAKVGGILANSTYPAEFIYDNIMIISNIIQCSYLYKVKKLLNLGSACIYPKFAPQPMKEEDLLTGKLEPTNEPYALAKIAGIKLCRYYNEQYGTDFISVMPNNLYGYNDNFNLETSHVLPALIRKFHLARLLSEKKYKLIVNDFQIFRGAGPAEQQQSKDERRINEQLARYGILKDSVTLWGTGEVNRAFLFVDDLAEICVDFMKRLTYKEIGEFVNVGTGEEIKIKDLALMIKDFVGFKGNIEWDKTKPTGTPNKLLDMTKLRTLGRQPTVKLADGIKKTYAWYLNKSGNGE